MALDLDKLEKQLDESLEREDLEAVMTEFLKRRQILQIEQEERLHAEDILKDNLSEASEDYIEKYSKLSSLKDCIIDAMIEFKNKFIAALAIKSIDSFIHDDSGEIISKRGLDVLNKREYKKEKYIYNHEQDVQRPEKE